MTLLKTAETKKIRKKVDQEKNGQAWKKLEEIGEKISKNWKSSKSCMQLISESRK